MRNVCPPPPVDDGALSCYVRLLSFFAGSTTLASRET